MTLTENYGVQKPGLTDPVDIEVLNDNFDLIDKQLKEIEESEESEGTGMTDEERAQLEQNTTDIADLKDSVQQNREDIDALPVTVTEDGYTDIAGQRQATDIVFTRTEQNIAIDITMQGAVAYNGVLELDENGFPAKYTENGLEVSMGFVGFDDLVTTVWEGGSY